MGYTSSTRIAYVPFFSFQEFNSAQEAITDLAKFFKEQYDKRHTTKVKKCCKPYKDKGDTFCGKCGSNLTAATFDVEDFQQFLIDMTSATIDDYGDYLDDETYDSKVRWEPSMNHNVSFTDSHPEHLKHVWISQAEDLLPAAIGHTPDERREAKDIFESPDDDSYCFW